METFENVGSSQSELVDAKVVEDEKLVKVANQELVDEVVEQQEIPYEYQSDKLLDGYDPYEDALESHT